jgi:hypothetical protein
MESSDEVLAQGCVDGGLQIGSEKEEVSDVLMHLRLLS